MTEVRFFDKEYLPGQTLTYSVIVARYKNDWVFVRNHKRKTFEIPGGHIEHGETSDEAASRELREETGAQEFSISRVATYSVTKEGETLWGRLYFADIEKTGPVPDISEIAEVIMARDLPEENTHPDIQPFLFRRVLEFLKESKKSLGV